MESKKEEAAVLRMGEAEAQEKKVTVVQLPIEQLHPNDTNPNVMPDSMFNALVDNIKEIGMVEPVLVCKDPKDENRYEIVGGEHRWLACKTLGHETIPAVVMDWDADFRKFVGVRMNILKGHLDPVRFTQLFNSLAEKYGKEAVQQAMKFTDQAAFEKVYLDVKRKLPKEVKKQLDKARGEIKNIDDLSRILNEAFARYGDTLNQSFMVFTFGGQPHLWVIMTDELYIRMMKEIVPEARSRGFDLNDLLMVSTTSWRELAEALPVKAQAIPEGGESGADAEGEGFDPDALEEGGPASFGEGGPDDWEDGFEEGLSDGEE